MRVSEASFYRVAPRGTRQLYFNSPHPFESPSNMSDDEDKDLMQLGKRSLDAIIEGVAAKLWETPPDKRPKEGPGTSSAGKRKI